MLMYHLDLFISITNRNVLQLVCLLHNAKQAINIFNNLWWVGEMQNVAVYMSLFKNL